MKKVLDGCTAATHVAYAMSEVATIYPITPIAEMGQVAQKWAMAGRKNLFGQTMQVKEMESELGAAGATHGAAEAGALATTFTNSQGLLLMIPNMYKIAGNMLPVVFHVGTRSLSTHALSIFGDHQDIMAARSTGFAFLGSANVQETMDLAIVAHIAALEGELPVLHFFDGWRTSNEMSSIDVVDYDAIASIMPMDAVARFRRKALNPEHPSVRGACQGPEVYFQNREAPNRYYDAFPKVVESAMAKVESITGRKYRLFDYVGADDAEYIAIAMGSAVETLEAVSSAMNRQGSKTGVVKVRLFRPFSVDALIDSLPLSVKRIAVLDRSKEPGAPGEPLYLDVVAAMAARGRSVEVVGGRYGLSSKDFSPVMAKAVFDNIMSSTPKRRFTVGINDDVTNLSLSVGPKFTVDSAVKKAVRFYGFGSDGTVGATRQLARTLDAEAGRYVQVFFQYSAKKSGGYTISELRIADAPINEAYMIENADYIGCHKSNYVSRFKLVENLKLGGRFVLNAPWTSIEALELNLPAVLRQALAEKQAHIHVIDAESIAARYGLGTRINMIMATVFLKLEYADQFNMLFSNLKEQIKAQYIHEGQQVVDNNLAAVDEAVEAIVEIEVPRQWSDAPKAAAKWSGDEAPDFIAKIARPCLKLEGDALPVSMFDPAGILPMGTTAFEKRSVAINVPKWDVDRCVECAECSLCCPHAAIRPVLMTEQEAEAAPKGFVSKMAHGNSELKDYRFRIQVFAADCMGCGICASICPGKALTMVPLETQLAEQGVLADYMVANIPYKGGTAYRFTVNGSQFYQPLMQFSGACAGCGETPYVKLLTQLFGERLLIANATGCSSVWGAYFPSNAYCVNAEGKGPAWGNSLFEDNAEYGFGMATAVEHRRAMLADAVRHAAEAESTYSQLRDLMKAWLDAFNDVEASQRLGLQIVDMVKRLPKTPFADQIMANSDMFGVKSVWAIGGDGWAYDIGFAGLDHVLAQDRNINILVLDTECYSNTGGQMSKATPIGSTAKYSPDGKRTFKKDLGKMMMTYGNVYVAQIALGANFQQAIDALREAEAYDGPSIVIAYCPCINHGIRNGGLQHAVFEERDAVKSGYWQLYRYNPVLAAEGRQPLTVDYDEPNGTLVNFINGENRYADLKMVDPRMAAILQPKLAMKANLIYYDLTKRVAAKLF